MKSLVEYISESSSSKAKVGEIGSWHGSFATVFYVDDTLVAGIVGSFSGKEFDEMKKKYDAEDPKFFDEWEDYMFECTPKEWMKQQ